MRVVAMANNRLGWRCLEVVRRTGAEVVGLVVHPPGRARFLDEIRDVAGISDDRVFDGSRLREAPIVEALRALEPDLGLSLLFDYILRPEVIELFRRGVVNLHPSYLPWNRGQYPNVWSIVEGTPAGVTLHYINEGVDTGDLIARRRVPVRPTDTGLTLYRRLEEAGLALFEDVWPALVAGTAPREPQPDEEGTYHRTRDVAAIDEIDLDQSYRAGDLIDVLRARTFPPYPGAYFVHGGEKIYLRLQILREGELES